MKKDEVNYVIKDKADNMYICDFSLEYNLTTNISMADVFGKLEAQFIIKYLKGFVILPNPPVKEGETRIFGGKDDKQFWADKPIQKNHPNFKEQEKELPWSVNAVCECVNPIPQATLSHACQNCHKILREYSFKK